MGISDLIAQFLQESLNEAADGVLEVQRSDLAQRFNCVPSQINYVMTTRFSPEHGYLVESRRGGGGYIRITQVRTDRQTLLMHVINSVGSQMDLPLPGPSSRTWCSPGRWRKALPTPSTPPWASGAWRRSPRSGGQPSGRT